MAIKRTSSETATAPVPEVVRELVAKFAEHQERYKRGNYNETQLRRDFLDPFFGAMGWDMDNRKGYAEEFGKGTVHEFMY